jgi:hypothetical protein
LKVNKKEALTRKYLGLNPMKAQDPRKYLFPNPFMAKKTRKSAADIIPLDGALTFFKV